MHYYFLVICLLFSGFIKQINSYLYTYTAFILYKIELKKSFVMFCHFCSMVVDVEGKATLYAVTLMLPVKASSLGFIHVIRFNLH